MSHYLGIDIGGTSTRFLLMNQQQQFKRYQKISTYEWASQNDPLAALAKIIKHYLNEDSVKKVMLGLPGILSRDRRQVISLPFICQLDQQPVALMLHQQLGVPVLMDKDVNHLMLWDLYQQSVLPDIALGFYLGTGLGNSIWLNGAFYHGAHGASGELGHIPWPDNQAHCPCGNIGCVETITSGHWLSTWAKPEQSLSELFTLHKQHPDIQQYIERLAQVIAGEVNIFDPEMIIIGGGLVAMNDFPLTDLCQQIVKFLRPPKIFSAQQIYISRLTDETGCRGACLAAQQESQ